MRKTMTAKQEKAFVCKFWHISSEPIGTLDLKQPIESLVSHAPIGSFDFKQTIESFRLYELIENLNLKKPTGSLSLH